MPVRSLTDSERERLSGFPPEIPEDDLFSYFTLSGADRALVPARTAPTIQLGFAVALCAIRYLGFCPETSRRHPSQSCDTWEIRSERRWSRSSDTGSESRPAPTT